MAHRCCRRRRRRRRVGVAAAALSQPCPRARAQTHPWPLPHAVATLAAAVGTLAVLFRTFGERVGRRGDGVAIEAAAGSLRTAHSSPPSCAGPKGPPVLQPFPGPPLKQLPQFGGEQEERLLWGTYRPGYYFGALLLFGQQGACFRCGWRHAQAPAVQLSTSQRTDGQAMVAPRRGAGMRMRRPQSLVAGVMWMDPNRWDPLNNIRCGWWG